MIQHENKEKIEAIREAIKESELKAELEKEKQEKLDQLRRENEQDSNVDEEIIEVPKKISPDEIINFVNEIKNQIKYVGKSEIQKTEVNELLDYAKNISQEIFSKAKAYTERKKPEVDFEKKEIIVSNQSVSENNNLDNKI